MYTKRRIKYQLMTDEGNEIEHVRLYILVFDIILLSSTYYYIDYAWKGIILGIPKATGPQVLVATVLFNF